MIKILKPAKPGNTLRDPATGRNLPSEGKAVVMSTFWRRRIEDGSVVEIAPPSPALPEVESVPEMPKRNYTPKRVKESDNGLA